jgi:hypothetical protein
MPLKVILLFNDHYVYLKQVVLSLRQKTVATNSSIFEINYETTYSKKSAR